MRRERPTMARARWQLLSSPPHLMFLDLSLPGLDGFQVARALRKQSPEITILALTAWARTEDRQRMRDAGFDEHLLKPLVDEALHEVLAIRLQAA